MKFRKILKHIDLDIKVALYEMCDNYELPLFSGKAYDIPWKYLDMELDTDEIGEAIGIATIDSTPHLMIYLKEGEK